MNQVLVNKTKSKIFVSKLNNKNKTSQKSIRFVMIQTKIADYFIL
jgi:hypothetical protein